MRWARIASSHDRELGLDGLEAVAQPLQLRIRLGLLTLGHAFQIAGEQHEAVLELVDVGLMRIEAVLLLGKPAQRL